MKQEFDPWYSEMLAPNGKRIMEIQDLPEKTLREAREAVLWELLFEFEIFGRIHGVRVKRDERTKVGTRRQEACRGCGERRR